MSDTYYYADGKRQALIESGDKVAVDTAAARRAGVGNLDAALAAASKLPSGVVMIDSNRLSGEMQKLLSAAGALRPVYRAGKALVVAMPEVRVEFDGAGREDALRAASNAGIEADIDDQADRLVLRPSSGRSEDALRLANFIYEEAKPAAASVRMLQVVSRPKLA